MEDLMSKRTLRNAAPELLDASRGALRFLLAQKGHDPYVDNERSVVLQRLLTAIDRADGDDATAGMIVFVVTHVTAAEMIKLAKKEGDREIAAALENGTRETKRRVYLTLEAEAPLLKRLKAMLQKDNRSSTKRAFDRLVAQIDSEVLSKTPLQLLARTAL